MTLSSILGLGHNRNNHLNTRQLDILLLLFELLPLYFFKAIEMTALTEHRSFLSDILTRQYERRRLIDPGHTFLPQPSVTGHTPRDDTFGEASGQAVAGPSKRRIVNYVQEEETVRNDLSGWYVQSGEFGSNYIHGAAEKEICEE